jgi:hypothetical protein
MNQWMNRKADHPVTATLVQSEPEREKEGQVELGSVDKSSGYNYSLYKSVWPTGVKAPTSAATERITLPQM